MNDVNVIQNRRGLTMETKYLHLAIDALRDGNNRLVERTASERKFFAKSSQEFK